MDAEYRYPTGGFTAWATFARLRNLNYSWGAEAEKVNWVKLGGKLGQSGLFLRYVTFLRCNSYGVEIRGGWSTSHESVR